MSPKQDAESLFPKTAYESNALPDARKVKNGKKFLRVETVG